MTIHVQDDEALCKEYWKRVTSLEEGNFMTTIVKKPSLWRKPLPYGTITVRYNSLEMLRRIKNDISRLVESCEENPAITT